MSHVRNRRGEGVRLRTDILAAATDLLDRGGERAVTLRAVARAAGIATPSIYQHFPDRPTLLLAVIHASFAELAHQLRTAAEGAAAKGTAADGTVAEGAATEATATDGTAAEGADARQRLYAAGQAYLDFADRHPRRYRAMFGSANAGLAVLRHFTGALTDCAAGGHSTSTDPAGDAIALWLGLHGLADQRAVTHLFPWPQDLLPHLVASLAHLPPD